MPSTNSSRSIILKPEAKAILACIPSTVRAGDWAIRGVGSKRRMAADGSAYGGQRFSRGALSAFRKCLFNRLARKLPPDHDRAQLRADDLGSQPIVFDNFESELIKAATAEGASVI